MPHTYPHIPLARLAAFPRQVAARTLRRCDRGTRLERRRGAGRAQATGLDSNTLVMFSSDNGPWYQGSPGRLRGRKGIDLGRRRARARSSRAGRGRSRAGHRRTASRAPSTSLPTVAKLCGAALAPRPLDGIDIWPLLSGKQPQSSAKCCSTSTAGTCSARGWDDGSCTSRATTPSPINPPPATGRVNLPLPHAGVVRRGVGCGRELRRRARKPQSCGGDPGARREADRRLPGAGEDRLREDQGEPHHSVGSGRGSPPRSRRNSKDNSP